MIHIYQIKDWISAVKDLELMLLRGEATIHISINDSFDRMLIDQTNQDVKEFLARKNYNRIKGNLTFNELLRNAINHAKGEKFENEFTRKLVKCMARRRETLRGGGSGELHLEYPAARLGEVCIAAAAELFKKDVALGQTGQSYASLIANSRSFEGRILTKKEVSTNCRGGYLDTNIKKIIPALNPPFDRIDVYRSIKTDNKTIIIFYSDKRIYGKGIHKDVANTMRALEIDTSSDTWVDDLAQRTYSGIQWRCEGNKPHGKLHKQFTKGITKAFETSIARFGVVQATDFNASKQYFAVHQEVFQSCDLAKRIDNLDLIC